MKITEKLKPKKVDDLVGNEKAFKEMQNHLMNGDPTLLVGPPGVGKTSSVEAYANEHNMKIIEVNASDDRSEEALKKVLDRARHKSIGREYIILLDEVDGIGNEDVVEEIIKQSLHPIVLTANEEYKLPSNIKKLTRSVKFWRPRKRDVAEALRRFDKRDDVDIDFSNASKDVRESILNTVYGGDEYDKDKSDFDIIKKILTGKDFNPDTVEREHIIWLMDNVTRFYFGRDVYKAVKILSIVDRVRDYSLLKYMPEGNGRSKVKYPRYFRRVKALR